MKVAIIGGGAAGFFAAIACAEANPTARVTIFERGKDVLEKVRISGGGRCNVTHDCHDPRELVKNYPRGSRELLGPFSHFGPTETVNWFQNRHVHLKTESDGRIFPTTDNSETIIECLFQAVRAARVEVKTSCRVEKIEPRAIENSWLVWLAGEMEPRVFSKIMVAAGSSSAVWKMLENLGHSIVAPVPSLFTFNLKDGRIDGLMGLSVPRVSIKIGGEKLVSDGPLLITHWGMSGPAILKLSAWGARAFFNKNYRFSIEINWLFNKKRDAAIEALNETKRLFSKKTVLANCPFDLPNRLWQRLVSHLEIDEKKRWADLDKKTIERLADQLTAAVFEVNGKSTFKEEFVTAGGVDLREINFKTFESRLHPNLFLAGEILNIDAVTGGFNFQAAWTGGWIAGQAMVTV